MTGNLSEILNAAAEAVIKQGLDPLSVFDAIAVAAGAPLGDVLTDEAFNATRAFARWLGYSVGDELSIAQALTEWTNHPDQTTADIIIQLRRAATQYAQVAR